ncbi:Neuronal-specific septin-3 [Madurella mycetomatis]|uniref:Neuronal-specific septin-3 n=1 Tax=Madurella mycetomatis TaxID=100816 RepID=A0A175WFK3_9PEZI|nr:Neuronal-specific septin-3 [Madurella mycetomatis]
MLLRRSKSADLKKQRAAKEQELQRQRDAVSKSPPRLPVLYNGAPAPQLGLGSEPRPDSLAIVSGRADHMPNVTPRPSMEPARSIISVPPPPPIPNGAFDPYAGTGSMAHRGRYSYASSAVSTINNPRRVRRRKDPTPFNILIVGTANSGKTSFLEFLKTALALPAKKRSKSIIEQEDLAKPPPSGNFIPHYLETEIDGERIGLTLWDSEGLEKNVVDLQLREMSSFLESKFEETFNEEMKVVRSPGVQDTHIHAVFLVLDPARLDRNIAAAKAANANGQRSGGKHYPHARILGSLDEDLDLQVLRTLQGKTTVIPVISKADTITTKHMNVLKRTVSESLKKANLDPLEALGLDDEDESSPDSSRIAEEDEDHVSEQGEMEAGADDQDLPIQRQASSTSSGRSSSDSVRRHKASDESPKEDEVPFLPMSILSPDIYEPGVVGRQFPWGFADPYNEEHCDFLRLKDAVFSDWRSELRELSREQWYEGWRTSRLKQHGGKAHR